MTWQDRLRTVAEIGGVILVIVAIVVAYYVAMRWARRLAYFGLSVIGGGIAAIPIGYVIFGEAAVIYGLVGVLVGLSLEMWE